MKSAKILVPASAKRALKMPDGYAMFGTGTLGISVMTKREKIAEDQQPVDNPVMNEVQQRRWDQSRSSL